MKIVNYHQKNENKPRSFFFGLNILLIALVLLFFFAKKAEASYLCLGLLILLHLFYWLGRAAFYRFALGWIAVTEKINALLLPIFLTLFYYFIFSPYALILRLFKKKKAPQWTQSSRELSFKDPF